MSKLQIGEKIDMECEAFATPVGRYYKTPSGNFPSVTTVLDQTMNGGKARGLREWWKRDPEEADEISETARAKGTLIHDIAEHHFGGGEIDWSKIDPEIAETAESLINLVEMELDEVWYQEMAIYHPVYGYAGRLDMVGVWRGVPCVIDFKTSRKPRYRSHHAQDNFPQLAAYATAFNYHFEGGAQMTTDKSEIRDGVIFNVVHGKGVQQPFHIHLDGGWDEVWRGRLADFRTLANKGYLHKNRNWSE